MKTTNEKDILCTLGPNSLNQKVIERMDYLGVDLFRLNLSHVQISDLKNIIKNIRNYSSTPICLDSEGAQIRTGALLNGEFTVQKGQTATISRGPLIGTQDNFNLYPEDIIDRLEIGDTLSIDFNHAKGEVTEKGSDQLTIKFTNGGKIGSHKAVTTERSISLPAMTKKDKEAFSVGLEMNIKNFALSFANRASDLTECREILGPDVRLISKIECINGLVNLKEIIANSDAILIDRGDLSREVAIEKVPLVQKEIVKQARLQNTKSYVATNLLESMIKKASPTCAEVNDIYNCLEDGVAGLVLAAETAIGDHPIKCVEFLKKIIKLSSEKDSYSETSSIIDLLTIPQLSENGTKPKLSERVPNLK